MEAHISPAKCPSGRHPWSLDFLCRQKPAKVPLSRDLRLQDSHNDRGLRAYAVFPCFSVRTVTSFISSCPPAVSGTSTEAFKFTASPAKSGDQRLRPRPVQNDSFLLFKSRLNIRAQKSFCAGYGMQRPLSGIADADPVGDHISRHGNRPIGCFFHSKSIFRGSTSVSSAASSRIVSCPPGL